MKFPLSRSVGVVGVLCGLIWLFCILAGELQVYSTTYMDMLTSSIVFVLVLIFTPGVLTIYFGARLTFAPSEKYVCRAIASEMLLLILVVSAKATLLDNPFVPEEMVGMVYLAMATVVAIPAYLFVCTILVMREFEETSVVESKPPAYFMAFLVLIVGFSGLHVYDATHEHANQGIPEVSWESLKFFIPFILAWGAYKAVTIFGKRLSALVRVCFCRQ